MTIGAQGPHGAQGPPPKKEKLVLIRFRALFSIWGASWRYLGPDVKYFEPVFGYLFDSWGWGGQSWKKWPNAK